jgi:DNA-binding transcriptional regulator YiaG
MDEHEQLPEDVGDTPTELAAAPATDGVESSQPVKQKAPRAKAKEPLHPNNVRRIRTEIMLSKAEVARRANISVLTLDRVERGFGCRVDTKRKILEALGLTLADRVRVFGEEE